MSGQPTLDSEYIASLANAFSKDDPIDLVGLDICILTCILSGVQDGSPYRPTSPRDDNLSTCAHLAYILRVPSDMNPAVTGNISPSGLVYAVAFGNARDPDTTGNSVTEIARGAERDAEDLLSTELNEIQTVDFSFHLRDVHTVFNYIVSAPPDKRSIDLILGLTAFVVRRSFSNVLRRVDYADRAWGTSPLAIIHDYYQESPEARGAARSGRVALVGSSIRDVLSHYNIEPTFLSESPGGHLKLEYDFGPDNVLAWTDTLVRMLSHLESSLGSPHGETPQRPPVMRIVGTLRALDTLFRSNLIDLLLAPPVVGTLVIAELESRMARSRQTCKATESGRADAEQDASDDDNDADVYGSDPEIATRTRVVRYLHSLTAPASVARELVRRASTLWPHPPPLRTYHVAMGPAAAKIERGKVEAFKARFSECGSQVQRGSARRYFEREDVARRLSPRYLDGRVSVHAEAALMALASAHAQEAPLPEWACASGEVFQYTEIAIGTSKKCCRCCELLRAHLQARTSGSGVSFRVRGSHAVIHPWAPPPVGVPLRVLVDIRWRLLLCLAKRTAVGVPSARTNPPSPDESLDDMKQASDVQLMFG